MWRATSEGCEVLKFLSILRVKDGQLDSKQTLSYQPPPFIRTGANKITGAMPIT
jgi:hypothetical protein